MKWFTIRQNNSGGYWVVNENVCKYVCVQAPNAMCAMTIAKEFCDNSDSCLCCGDRWLFYLDDRDGNDVPSIYGEPICDMDDEGEARLHYVDGRVLTQKFGYPFIQ